MTGLGILPTLTGEGIEDIAEAERQHRRSARVGEIAYFEHLKAKRPIEATAVRRDLERLVDEHIYLARTRPATADFYRDKTGPLAELCRYFGWATVAEGPNDLS